MTYGLSDLFIQSFLFVHAHTTLNQINMFPRSLTTIGIPNAMILFHEIQSFRGRDDDVTMAHADDGTAVYMYGRTAPIEIDQDKDEVSTFPGTRSDAIAHMISTRLWETPGTYVFLCSSGEKLRVKFGTL